MPASLTELLDDLAAEEAALDRLLGSLASADWDRATPAAGWMVRDQVAHLAIGEELATLAVTEPERFTARLGELMADLDALEADQAVQARRLAPEELRSWWATSAAATCRAVREHGGAERIAWITGPMSAASFVTARLMETWAHGRDVAAAVGVEPVRSARLRHVADLGVRTRRFSFRNRGLEVPPVEPRVELTGPGGERWTWGDRDAPERVEGPAEDFCLVVCRRRDVADTELVATGEGAAAWLRVAQCFAGP